MLTILLVHSSCETGIEINITHSQHSVSLSKTFVVCIIRISNMVWRTKKRMQLLHNLRRSIRIASVVFSRLVIRQSSNFPGSLFTVALATVIPKIIRKKKLSLVNDESCYSIENKLQHISDKLLLTCRNTI